MQQGDFHLCFTESWGPPYDPQSFATGWFRPDNEAHYPAMQKMEAPMTMKKMEELVTDVLSEENLIQRQAKWTNILQEMHRQAISNPMWSRRVPAIWNNRLAGYLPGPQQYDYPMHTFSAMSGSTTITVAPGAQTGLFVTTGPMDPHSYRPNEFFISNWIYEGLVHYGQNGAILPALATSWKIIETQGGGEQYRFTLRSNVKFHDGTAFNCAAVKMNFDHVLHPPLNNNWYHGWYHLALHTVGWQCDGEVFVVDLDGPYYPFLQELSLIRPLRMLSPESFINGLSTDKTTQNSCPLKWNNDNGFLGPPPGFTEEVKCAGVRSVHGTGPWKYQSTKYYNNDEAQGIQEVHFVKNENWWGNSGRGNIEKMIVKHYADSDAIAAALLDKSLDVAVGDKVLRPEQVKDFQTARSATHGFANGPPLLNQIVVINAAKAPTDDIQVRRLIMHSVDKATIVAKELHGQAQVADSMFPKDAPYCDVDLTPRWDYDLEKAQLMNCPEAVEGNSDDLPLILGLTFGIGIPLLLLIGAGAFFIGRRKGYNDLDKQRARDDQQKGTTLGATI
eukprot:TRINITY_DN14669_c0_g1_i3.p1 TRINITY_DN14669_c0_g1~~TRINITY_DN14669_c0_g1_i3.p1  ORF type:complete len:646 (-),score=126.69 TRINITY_DN14669_c0_g1_i3:227-1906(-)